MKTVLTLLAATGAACVVLAAPAAATGKKPVLNGTVGPGFTITLVKSGKKVKRLKPGTYRLAVADKASIHNFELEGPGVKNVETGVSAKGTKTFTVTLKKGTYTFFCVPHASSMRGSFVVG